MEVQAVTKFVRLSPQKARDLARAISGKPVQQALDVVTFSERKAAAIIGKTLRSAIANAENNHELSVEDLHVREAVVEQGPTFGRYWPRARGMVRAITRKTSHVRITLTDQKIGKKAGKR